MRKHTFHKAYEFKQFLTQENGISENSADSYLDYIKSVEKHIGILNFEGLSNKANYIQDIIDSLGSSHVAERYNLSHKYIGNWKSALNSYLQFILQSDIEESESDNSVDETEESLYPANNDLYSYTKEEIYTNFTHRLITQDRIYPPVFFQISLIKRLFYKNSPLTKKYFDNWITKTLENTILITQNEEYALKEITSLHIAIEDGVCENYIIVNGKKKILHSHTADGKMAKMEESKLKNIVLDHITPMSKILEDGKSEFTGLKRLTDKIKNHINTQNLRNSARMAANKHFDDLLEETDLIDLLKRDLEVILLNTKLELMKRHENSKKSNK